MKLVLTTIFFLCVILPLPSSNAGSITSGEMSKAKQFMVQRHLISRGIKNPQVLEAMRLVPREKFISPSQAKAAYNDSPLPIGEGQTISQPYIVALMTELLAPSENDKVLEVGAGSGYQAAVLAQIVGKVFTIEIIERLAAGAEKVLAELGIENVTVRHGDGYGGWKRHAPFDKIIITAAADHVPGPLEDQLKEGGLIVMPVGGRMAQELLLGRKLDGKMIYKKVIPVRFVPMTGEVEK